MAASINDKIIASENGGAPVPTTVSSERSIDGTTLSCVALTNWPTDTAVHLITYKKKTDGTIDHDTLCLWKGIVSGTAIGTLTLKGGTDAGNAVGDFVEMAPTSSLWQDLYDGLTQEHKVTGKHSDVTFDSLTANSGASVDFSEAPLAPSDIALTKTTDANGWTVYNHGTWKEYIKLLTGGSVSSLGVGAGVAVWSSQDLPIGIKRGDVYINLQGGNDGSSGNRYVYGVDGNRSGTDTSTTFQVVVRNVSVATLTESGLTCVVRAIDR